MTGADGAQRPDLPANPSLLAFANQLMRQRSVVVTTALACVVVVVAAVLLTPREWTSAASFVPQTRRPPSNVAGIAAQLGVTLPQGEPTQSPAFYADLLKSRELLGAVADQPFDPGAGGERQGTLAEFFRVRGDTPALKREAVIKRLGEDVSVSVVQRTGVVKMSVSLKDPKVAEQVASKLLAEINRFNLESRQSQAGAERRFTEQRLDEVKGDLRKAEDRLQVFLQQNRDFRNSPQLAFQQDRLAREVTMQQQLYTALAQAYEQAKLDEVRDTPVITVVERPRVPVKPDPRGLAKKGLLGLILGLMLGAFLARLRDGSGRFAAGGSREQEEFDRLSRETLADLWRPWRLVPRGERSRQS